MMFNKKRKRINIGLIGAGGYAAFHLKLIRQFSKKGVCQLKAVAIRNSTDPKYKKIRDELSSDGITIYPTYQDLYKKEKNKIHLIIIPCGIDQHAELSVQALQYGYHVFCEKPVSGTIEEAFYMQQVQKNTGKMLIIGYQNIFSPSIQHIKEIRMNRELGELIKAKTMGAWPRSSVYYKRNKWAGKVEFNGKKIFDSPAQNGFAHFLNNMLYIAGEEKHTSAYPETIYSENYRAKDIESADTQYLYIKTLNQIEIYFMVTHACLQIFHPVTEYIFEKGKIIWYGSGTENKREKHMFI